MDAHQETRPKRADWRGKHLCIDQILYRVPTEGIAYACHVDRNNCSDCCSVDGSGLGVGPMEGGGSDVYCDIEQGEQLQCNARQERAFSPNTIDEEYSADDPSCKFDNPEYCRC